jgi:hypothetical protein
MNFSTHSVIRYTHDSSINYFWLDFKTIYLITVRPNIIKLHSNKLNLAIL